MPFPVDVIYVARAEEQLGIKLPLSYVARMLRSNGGSVDVNQDSFQLFPIFDDSDKKRLKRTCNDIVRETRMARERPDFPQDAVAIGSNGGGDHLLFLRSDHADRLSDEVCWWDHETGEINFVADDFLDLPKSD